jgi:hypothetical protein
MRIKLHNNLPTEIKRIENFKDFKNKNYFFTKLLLFFTRVFLVILKEGKISNYKIKDY